MSDAQAEYVRQWQERYWFDVFAVPWLCPLCNQAVQALTIGHPSAAVEEHQQMHGDDWARYQALATPDPAR